MNNQTEILNAYISLFSFLKMVFSTNFAKQIQNNKKVIEIFTAYKQAHPPTLSSLQHYNDTK